MDADPPMRRSSRAARPSKKYTIDPFEQYRELLEQESDNSRPPSLHDQDAESDDEFDEAQAVQELAQAAAEDEDEDYGDDASEDEVVPAAAPESGDAVTPKVKPTPAKRAVPVKKAPNKKRAENFSYNVLPIFDSMGNTGAKGRNIHFTRGVPEAVHTQGREVRVIYSVGPGEEDLKAHVQARERWLDDATVPHRRQKKGKAGGGLGYSTYYPEEKREREANEELGWYYEGGGRKNFQRDQVFNKVDKDYAPHNYSDSDGIVAGPINAQKHFTGPHFGDSWNMGDAYAGTSKSDQQRAWIMNAGARIQALEWCPNQGGTAQYFAVATSHSPSDPVIDKDVIAPAYTPHSRRQQCLQIWEVLAKSVDTSIGGKVDFAQKPKLRQVFSSDWGHIKKMRWYPIPDRPTEAKNRLGLLAAIFSDGCLRVFDLSSPGDNHDATDYLHIDKAAFASQSPETLFTCLTWLSSKNIAAGTADGSVAIWTIPDALKDSSSSRTNSHPWFYQRLHQGYIQSITCGYPSRPHILITYSFDGVLRATDLRSPNLDTVISQRSRIAQGPVVWHDITQSALNMDDNFTMKSYGVRMFYKSISVARLTAFGADVGVSPLHASVLVACVDGAVWVTNPMRRLRDHKHKPLVQCVLKHEWRRPVTASRAAATTTGGQNDDDLEMEADPILSKPLIRLMTGFKIQRSDMGQENRANATKDYVSFATVHEEKTAVTQVAWNPNLIAGTWAAIGMGSGLVVVKDLAAD